MKRILFILTLLLLPGLVLAQTSLKNIKGLSSIASKSSFSEQEVVTGFSAGNVGNGLFQLLEHSDLSNLSYSQNLLEALSEGMDNLTNTAIVMQNGANNLAQVNQSGGNSNIALLVQAGNNIQNTVTQQGNGNVYASKISGNDHRLDVSQIGNNNLYLLEYDSNKPLQNTVKQIGNGLKAIQLGRTSKPFQIKEYGRGMNIVIRHYNF